MASAANWLILQGTEKNGTAGRAKVWGFIQGQFQQDFSTSHPTNDKFTPAKLIGPNLTSQNQININRARIGVRGTGMPIDSRINYFILSEFGNNGITGKLGRAKITDASMTFNHIPFARIRFGVFKYPGSEEGLQAIHVADYINFSTVSNQLMLERFPNDDNYVKNASGSGNTDTQKLGTSPSGLEKPIGAYRDVGIQLFDSYKHDEWEHSYALMMGNGNGLNYGDNNTNKTMYYYLSTERIFNGSGARRQGIKVYAWYQSGLRSYDTDFSYTKQDSIDGENNTTIGDVYKSANKTNYQQYKRRRMGAGFKFLKSGYRLSAEYLQGTGMIFLGPHKESFDVNKFGAAEGNGLEGTANGWYVDAGWRILKSNFELDLRYDKYNRLTGDKFETNFTTMTIGLQYFANKKSRLTFNYTHRSAVSANGVQGLEKNFEGLGGRLALSAIAIF